MKTVILAGGNLSPETFDNILTSYTQCNVKNIFITNFLSELPMPEFNTSIDIQIRYCHSLPALLNTNGINFEESGVFILGGDQFKLRNYDLKTVQTFFSQFKVIGGTSAGAMIMGREYYGYIDENESVFETGKGLGLVDYYVDTHTFERSRLHRMQLFSGVVLGVNENSFISITIPEILNTQTNYIESLTPEKVFEINE